MNSSPKGTIKNVQYDRLVRSSQYRVAAGLPVLVLCVLGSLLTARGQDPNPNPAYPMDTNVTAGCSVRFTATANTGHPPLTYQWQHAGTNLPGATNQILTVANVAVPASGGYMCLLTNAIGSFTNTRTAQLIVDTTFTKITTGRPVTDSEGSTCATWIDYDQDGYLDLFVGNSGANVFNSLYRNNGDGSLTKITTNLLGTVAGSAWGVAWGDYDNDGKPDLFVANIQNRRAAQFHNEGGGRFTQVTTGVLVRDSLDSTLALWGDYDNDGFIDLYVPNGYLSGTQNDRLYHNEGNSEFSISTAAQVGPLVSDNARNYAHGWNDYDNDGDLDLFVQYTDTAGSFANYFVFNNLLSGPFEKVALTTFAGVGQTIASSWGDYDNDGYADLFLTAWGGPNALFKNLQGQGFTNVAATTGLKLAMASGSSGWGDYDNDGWLDLFVGNNEGGANFPGGHALFHNNRDGTFTRIRLAGEGGYATAVAWGDYDNDGDLDLYLGCGDSVPQRNLFYRNNGSTNHWLRVTLDGQASNRSGIGAKVRVLANIGGQVVHQMRSITGQHSWIGDNGLIAYFGLGDATNVTTLRIEWPSGIVQELQNVAANQILAVVESQGYTGASPQFSAAAKTAGGIELSFIEPAVGARYILEASTNLVTWTKLMARTSAGSSYQFTDTKGTNYTRRFYRLQVP